MTWSTFFDGGKELEGKVKNVWVEKYAKLSNSQKLFANMSIIESWWFMPLPIPSLS